VSSAAQGSFRTLADIRLPFGSRSATVPMMSEDGVVVFGDERGQVRLSYEPMDEDVGTLVVEMRAAGLTYELPVESGRGDGVAAFFLGLVDDWKGWRGVRHWETIWGELSIDATHRGQCVELLFVTRVPYRAGESGDPDVEVRLRIEVQPGEALSRLAATTARLTSASTDPELA
jgi:Family of unknown function (DUF6228)